MIIVLRRSQKIKDIIDLQENAFTFNTNTNDNSIAKMTGYSKVAKAKLFIRFLVRESVGIVT